MKVIPFRRKYRNPEYEQFLIEQQRAMDEFRKLETVYRLLVAVCIGGMILCYVSVYFVN